jgi:hypothetical protein
MGDEEGAQTAARTEIGSHASSFHMASDALASPLAWFWLLVAAVAESRTERDPMLRGKGPDVRAAVDPPLKSDEFDAVEYERVVARVLNNETH